MPSDNHGSIKFLQSPFAALTFVVAPALLTNASSVLAMKLAGNLIVALEMEALAEGLVLAQKAGLDLNTVMEVVKVADFRSPLLVSNGQNILKRDFSTSFALKLMLKDARLIDKFAGSLQSPIPGLRVVENHLKSAVALGFEKENASAVIKALEKEAGVEVKALSAAEAA